LLAAVRGVPGTSLDAIRNALRKGPPPLVAHRPDVPPALAAVVERALSFHAERRPQGIAELRAAIEDAVPRQVLDADVHRVLVAQIYGDPRFVQEHGELPTTPGVSADVGRNRNDVTTTAVGPKTVGRVRSRALRFGISPALGAAQARAASERFTAFLGERVEHEIRPVVLADYAMLVACLVQGEIDLAWMPPTAFVSATEHGAGVLAKIRRAGQTTYQSALIARRDGGVATLADLRGRPVAWVDHDSAGGYLFAVAELRRTLGDLDAALGEQHFVGSHRAVCETVAKGWADAGATYVSRDAAGRVVSAGWVDSLGDKASAVVPIWFSPPIPGDSIAHRPFLPDALARQVSAALLGLSETDAGRELLLEVFGAEALVEAHVSDYDGVREALSIEPV
jgi:phosphate/phosphite/phosphonate ABC transporter binding protein